MPSPASRNAATDLRGAARLGVAATAGLTGVVESMYRTFARGPTALGGPVVGGAIQGVAGLVFVSVRGLTHAVGAGLDLALGALAPAVPHVPSSPRWDSALAALNGVVGDYLAETGNPLAAPMEFRAGGRPLPLTAAGIAEAIPTPGRRILVLVHGLCGDDRVWRRRRHHDHGAALARDLGYTAVYLRYNTGLHVSTNGRALSAQLEALLAAWPAPVDEVAILAHSMGGLVARSACHHAGLSSHAWPATLRTIVFLGTPHHGAPLERGGHWLHLVLGQVPYAAPLAQLGRIRSAGITDLRHGWLLDRDWEGHDRFARRRSPHRQPPLPRDVRCYAIAGVVGASPGAARARLVGDGLVRVGSALGQHRDADRRLAFPPSHQWIARRTSHLGLLGSLLVYRRVRAWLAA
jgi:hypothetical protein